MVKNNMELQLVKSCTVAGHSKSFLNYNLGNYDEFMNQNFNKKAHEAKNW